MDALGRLIILGSAALAVAACSQEPTFTVGDQQKLSGQRAADSLAPMTNGGSAPARSEGASAMLARADELRGSGEAVASLSVLAEAHRRYPRDGAVASAYGRMALLLGHEELAATLLEQAVAANPGDWRALSAKGVLETRHGRLPDGRRTLAKAGMISAGEAVILNNLAVSHLLEGKPGAAASLLRQGLAAPGLSARHEGRLKRNLGLALAMQGRFEEADRLAGEKLPRRLAEGDMGALRGLLGVSGVRLGRDGAGWKAQIATSARPDQPALR